MLLMASLPAGSSVGSRTLRELTVGSPVIVVGTVGEVVELEGWWVAEVAIDTTIKGEATDRVRVLASPTWTCDISTVVPGETALFFLNGDFLDSEPVPCPPRGPTEPDWASGPGSISVTVHADAYRDRPRGAAPCGFRESYRDHFGQEPLLTIGYSGRGRMPRRTVGVEDYFTMWPGDLKLPWHMNEVELPVESSYMTRAVRSERLLRYLRRVGR